MIFRTDKCIQQTIRTKFENFTVLTVAHRLHTVMDCDRILVMESGRIAEIGQPHELLKNTNGHLRKLVDKTGESTSKVLEKLAFESYSISKQK